MVSNPLEANHEHEDAIIQFAVTQFAITQRKEEPHIHMYCSLEPRPPPPQKVRYVLYNSDSVYTYILYVIRIYIVHLKNFCNHSSIFNVYITCNDPVVNTKSRALQFSYVSPKHHKWCA